ncbi:MAG: glutamate-1-semialdehyde-2,1-aminomutase [Bradymonadales bacterium]|nr:MAG: glutamate-1-semialdehyde-2,1-aminomutase [Bradymonadales bacterium]
MILNFERSKILNQRARKCMPGGVSSPVRSFSGVGGEAFVAARAEGPFLFDVDGNRYIDLVGSWGPMIHGHNPPEVVEAVRAAIDRGFSYGVTCETEIELCESIVESVPSCEMIRLVNSGTEACMSALRLARAVTDRDLILKFEGHYHGHADSFLINAGSGLATFGTASSAGIPETQTKSTLTIPFNSVEAVEKVFSDFGDRIAGVFLEVVTGNMGVVRPDLDFLSKLRESCDRYQSLLIFDEVMTGFRLSLAGAQGVYPIKPDLSCFGKVIGGGFPVGAYGGRRDLMEWVAPLGQMYQAGTLSGNPIGTAAGLASLNLIRKDPNLFYQKLDHAGSEWRSRLEAHISHRSYPVCVEQEGSMLSLFFCPEKPRNYREVQKTDLNRFKKFFWALLEKGVYYPPSAFESCFLSSALETSLMEQVMEASTEALDECFEAT